MHALGAAVEPHERVVLEDADHGRGDRGAGDVADGRVSSDVGHDELGRAPRRVGPSARTSFGVGSGCPAPAARTRSISAEATLVGRVLGHLELDLAEAGGDAIAVEHRHLVVGDLRRCAAPGIEERERCAGSVCRRATGCNGVDPHVRAHEVERRDGISAGRPMKSCSGRESTPSSVLPGSFTVQIAAAGFGAIAGRDPPTDQTEIGGVPIRRVERDVGAGARRDRRQDAIEVGEDEPRPGGELRLALDPAVRSGRSCASATERELLQSAVRVVVVDRLSTRVHRPSASSSQASTSSVRLTSSTS